MTINTKAHALLELDLCEIADLISRGEVSALEVTQAAVDAAEGVGRHINAIIETEAAEALTAAEALDNARGRNQTFGPLHGVPLANKDMFYRRGIVCSGGSAIRRDFRPDVTATVVERLERAGAVNIARLNMAEFALNPTGHNIHFGDCKNPWNQDYCTGGSSSGSGAAVASRIVFGSLGSDTGGSIRMPASMCGVTGLKGTQGLVSRYGVMPLSYSVDCVGPIARSARDCARLLCVISGADDRDPTCVREAAVDYESELHGNLTGLRIAYAPVGFGFDTDPELPGTVVEALEVLRGRGASISSVDIADVDALITFAGLVQRSEMAAIHANWMRTSPEKYAIHVSSRIFAGYGIPATAYIEAVSRRGSLLKSFCASVFGQADVLVMPSMTMKVPTRAEADMDNGGPEAEEIFGRVTENARLINYLGLPAISIPCGFDSRGLPIGMQIVGRPFSEATLLKVADAYQRDTQWHRMKPAIIANQPGRRTGDPI